VCLNDPSRDAESLDFLQMLIRNLELCNKDADSENIGWQVRIEETTKKARWDGRRGGDHERGGVNSDDRPKVNTTPREREGKEEAR